MEEFNLGEWLQEDVKTVGLAQEVKAPTLTSNEVRILNYCEQVFWETGILPTPENVQEELTVGIHLVRKAFRDETFKNQVASRGIDPEGLITPGKLITQSKALSAKQIVCANMMLNLHDKRTEREKLAEIQVSSQQYHAWLRQPAFVEFLRKRGEALFSASDFKAYRSLINNVQAGDNKSLELFFRMRGIYNPSVTVEIRVDVVIQQVVEIISRHVKDPAVLNAIANEIDSIVDAEEVA